jgi:hypothetical protein
LADRGGISARAARLAIQITSQGRCCFAVDTGFRMGEFDFRLAVVTFVITGLLPAIMIMVLMFR